MRVVYRRTGPVLVSFAIGLAACADSTVDPPRPSASGGAAGATGGTGGSASGGHGTATGGAAPGGAGGVPGGQGGADGVPGGQGGAGGAPGGQGGGGGPAPLGDASSWNGELVVEVSETSFVVTGQVLGDANGNATGQLRFCNETELGPSCLYQGPAPQVVQASRVGSALVATVSGLAAPDGPGDTFDFSFQLLDSDGVVDSAWRGGTARLLHLGTTADALFLSHASATGFTAIVPFSGDEDDDATAVLHVCNDTDAPGCDPAGAPGMAMAKDGGAFVAQVAGLAAPNDPGDHLSVLVELHDANWVDGPPLRGQIALQTETLVQTARMVPADAGTSYYGYDVDVEADVAVVGAPSATGGAVYVYTRQDETWQQAQRIVAPATVVWFGQSVSLSGETVAIGARTNAFVYRRDAATWISEAVLTGSGRFGDSVALDGDLLVVGDPWDNTEASHGGAAHVFRRVATTWSEEATHTYGSSAQSDGLGERVAAWDNRYLAVGAWRNLTMAGRLVDGTWRTEVFSSGDPSHLNYMTGEGVAMGSKHAAVRIQGADRIKLYRPTGPGWAFTQEIWGCASVGFDLEEHRLVVGCPGGSGLRTEVFDGKAWYVQNSFAPQDDVGGALFGSAVAVSGSVVMAGAPYSNGGVGAVYVLAYGP